MEHKHKHMHVCAESMKRLLIFLMFFMNAGAAVACCYGYSRYNYATGSYSICGSYYRSNSIGYGAVVFDSFPYASWCNRGTCSASWVQTVRLCGGYNSSYSTGIYASRISVVADQGSACWRWTCRPGYTMEAGGRCMTLEEKCSELGLVVRNGACTPRWCDGWTSGFNASAHYEIGTGNCNQWRCKAGTWFSTESDKLNCKACTPVQGKRGGCYANTDDYTFKQCSAQQYTNYDGSRWECKNVEAVDDTSIKRCWKCEDNANMLRCMRGQGTC